MGILYIVPTPLGNLKDITFRAVETLKEVDLIAAEDTRHTLKLLNHYNIVKPLISYFQGNESSRIEKLLFEVLSGKNVALVSDAGTPAISDPGFKLVREAINKGVTVISLPGPSAIITALSVSGLPTDQFTFVGFLPDKEGKRKTKLTELKDCNQTLIFYVSKWKVNKILADMLEISGDRNAVLCREMTKVFEEVRRGTIASLLEYAGSKELKGEITMIVGGSNNR